MDEEWTPTSALGLLPTNVVWQADPNDYLWPWDFYGTCYAYLFNIKEKPFIIPDMLEVVISSNSSWKGVCHLGKVRLLDT